MEPFRSFTGNIRAGAWLASIHTLHDTDDERVEVALENIEDSAKLVLDEIARAVEAKQLKLWFWTWDKLQMAMLYVDKEESRVDNEKTLVSKIMNIPGNHPGVFRAISFTATAVSIGGAVAPVALGMTGLAASGVAKAATICNAHITGFAQGAFTSVISKLGIASAAKGIYDGVNGMTDMLGLTSKDIVKHGAELGNLKNVESMPTYGTRSYGHDEILLNMLCAVGKEESDK